MNTFLTLTEKMRTYPTGEKTAEGEFDRSLENHTWWGQKEIDYPVSLSVQELQGIKHN